MTKPPKSRADDLQPPDLRTEHLQPEIRTVWERAEPAPRPAPVPLSRDGIVRAAIAIADAEDLAAVSLRKVAAALDAGPMRLYGFMSTKDELLDLMADAVYAEMVPDEAATRDWRDALRVFARETRRIAHQHPWFVDLLGGRPRLGPNTLAHMERLLAALHAAPGFESIDAAVQAAKTINAYVIGVVRSEVSEIIAERESGMDKAAWQSANWHYMQRVIATGRFPTLAKVVRDASHPPADAVFDHGLDCVLDGIALRLLETKKKKKKSRVR
ncbi:TetR/AcrR family transcriptional regulator C-terminal domain-containing protein [Dongia sedimenti]|uniref:TetR/AcrR family transcriptional regulator C-terminal domain-containing protein n=1 Tax=Dongia sedimenti TaxID=3064282 RepID=A0ABU0YQE0_9PROT|nr:TetR/AcrR family transcriptional regulator C-terminal domain-containing protein [Rhodospirillaceae bacterium R-7]